MNPLQFNLQQNFQDANGRKKITIWTSNKNPKVRYLTFRADAVFIEATRYSKMLVVAVPEDVTTEKIHEMFGRADGNS